MRRTVFGWVAAAAVMTSVVAGCGGSGGDASSFVLPELPGSEEYYNTKTITVPSLLTTEKALVVATTGGVNEYDTITRDITVTPPVLGGEKSTKVNSRGQGPVDKTDRCGMYASLNRFDESVAASASTSSSSSETTEKQLSPQPRFEGQKAGWVDTMINPVAGNPAKTIKVMKMLNDAQTVHCNIMAEVELNEEGDYELRVPVDSEACVTIAKVFDYSNPYDPIKPSAIGIYNRLTGYLGHEWQFNPKGGRDGDTRVNIVLLSEDTMGVGLLGLVAFDDSFANSVSPISNEGEYVYINASTLWAGDNSEDSQASFFGTLAHEFSHLIQMNAKVAQDGKFTGFSYAHPENINQRAYEKWERRTIGEGFAETAATLCGFGVYGASDNSQTGGAELFAYDAINKYLGNTSLIAEGYYGATRYPTPFYAPFLNYSTTDPYGMGHLFGLMLVKRYGPAKFGELVSSNMIGNVNLETVLGEKVIDILHDYDMSMACAGLDNVPDKYVFPYLNFGKEKKNYYRLLGSKSAPKSHILGSFVPCVEQYIGDGEISDTRIDPYSPRTYMFLHGNNGDLSLKIRSPKDGKINVVRINAKGEYEAAFD